MLSNLLKQISARMKEFIPKTRNYDSISWYKNQVSKLIKERKKVDVRKLKEPIAGKMFLMMYDPKGKKELPYYDVFPLIFIVKLLPNGFIGLNLHYLPVAQRMQLLKALYNIGTNNQIMNENTKLLLSYKLIKSFSGSRHAKVCTKRYLYNKIRYMNLVFPEQWTYVASLPLERFMKESRNTVWSESLKKLKG